MEISAQDGERPHGMGILLQVFSAEAWRGKRVRYSSYLRTRDLRPEGYAQAYIRVESKDEVVFAMGNRSLQGNQDWSNLEIVIDIPQNAELVAWGAFLVGPGRLWVDSASLSIAPPDKEAAVSHYQRPGIDPNPFEVLKAPSNGDYEIGVEAGEHTYVTSIRPLW